MTRLGTRSLFLGLLGSFAFTTRTCFAIEKIFSSSISYCSASPILNVREFNFIYYPRNHSIWFDINAGLQTSTPINASAQLEFFAYGDTATQLSLDLCDVLSGSLCPLPTQNIDGGGTISLPTTFSLSIPHIGYTVPDLEAVAQVRLRNVDDNTQIACLESTLSNGHTARLKGVSWAAAGLAIGTLLLNYLWAIGLGGQQGQDREYLYFILIDSLQQTISVSSLLGLAYPAVLISFAINFSWADALLRIKSIDDAAGRLRRDTGGTGGNTTIPASFSAITINSASQGNVTRGIASYSTSLGISPGNVDTTAILLSLIYIAVLVGIIGLGYLLFRIFRRGLSRVIPNEILSPVTLRFVGGIMLLIWSPLATFSFYQFHTASQGGKGPTALASLVFIVGCLSMVWLVIDNLRRRQPLGKWRQRRPQTPRELAASWGTRTFVRAAIVGLGDKVSSTQVALLIALEATFLVWILFRLPLRARFSNIYVVVHTCLQIAVLGICTQFSPHRTGSGIRRAILGHVCLGIQSILVVLVFFILCVCVAMWFWRWRRPTEVGVDSTTSSDSETLRGSPLFNFRKSGHLKSET